MERVHELVEGLQAINRGQSNKLDIDLKRCAPPSLLAARARPPAATRSPTPRAILSSRRRRSACALRLCRRGIALQRDDIPMRPSVDFPTESEVELELPAPPEEKKE